MPGVWFCGLAADFLDAYLGYGVCSCKHVFLGVDLVDLGVVCPGAPVEGVEYGFCEVVEVYAAAVWEDEAQGDLVSGVWVCLGCAAGCFSPCGDDAAFCIYGGLGRVGDDFFTASGEAGPCFGVWAACDGEVDFGGCGGFR